MSECTVNVDALLPDSELASIVFLIQQYGQSQLPQDQSICSELDVVCEHDSVTGLDHLQQIHLKDTFTGSSTFPNASIELDLPLLRSLSMVDIGATKNTSINILSKIRNLKTLASLVIMVPNSLLIDYLSTFFYTFTHYSISGDGTISPIPSDFPTNMFGLSDIFLVDPIGPQSIDIVEKSFPSVYSVELDIFSDFDIDLGLDSTALYNVDIARRSQVGRLNLTFGNNSNLIQLFLTGSILLSGNSDLKDLQHLFTIETSVGQMTTYPFTAFPPALGKLLIRNASFEVMPSLQIPSNLTILEISSSQLTGSIVSNYLFENVMPGFNLNLAYNPGLTIAIPEEWCQFVSLNLLGTNIASAPDCFYCYYNVTNPKIQLSLTIPPNLVCNVTFKSMFLIAYYGYIAVEGELLGWGIPQASGVGVPNKRIVYDIGRNVVGPPMPFNITFVGQNYTFSVLEAGVLAIRSSVVLKSSGDVNEIVIQLFTINNYLTHNVTLVDRNNATCTVKNITASTITCTIPKSIQLSPSYTVLVANEYDATTLRSTFDYPTVTSVSYTASSRTLVLYGFYGSPITPPLTITVADTIDCSGSASSLRITCILASVPPAGPANLYISLGGLEFKSSTLLYFNSSNSGNNGTTTTGSTTTGTTSTTTGGNNGETPQEKCTRLTFDCYGHGQCDINGQCQCDETYNQIDNCLTKYINTNITPNATNPTVSFDIDGIDFQFEINSIQELDYDSSSVLQEILLLNQPWNVSVSSDNITTTADYTLNTTQIVANNSLFSSLVVESQVSFSSIARTIPFGNRNLDLAPNSIKVGFTIGNWSYTSNLATLRVVFKSIINNDQSVTFDCEKQSINSFTKDELSESIQYLRVVKDNIQFSGRFIDFVVSDGRVTYSKTELISSTPIDNSDDQSIALIGINLPQCSSCQLDPDFTPLLIDKGGDSGCKESQSNTWKIIVGVVVGGVALIAIAVGSIILIKKKSIAQTYENRLSSLNKSRD
ncbi:hypothetical protein DFA_08823 [Cavenderia fasciculata]|uniref:ComC supersandwich domain-containing protein n=1 Tax=Cavenderia fasciculata TaxID=261658 RepID=F4Q4H3_CACFS|nr:uncharacterized protein DFA_08823 [Cavenderia fasciculata]EGG17822.1 hypothetical protein DFA_08823 [Cavenderia fasciculata]|eukprot:XP_004356306.1 hypothetical protein DFA_08823 [Cavenderia fasciculata]